MHAIRSLSDYVYHCKTEHNLAQILRSQEKAENPSYDDSYNKKKNIALRKNKVMPSNKA